MDPCQHPCLELVSMTPANHESEVLYYGRTVLRCRKCGETVVRSPDRTARIRNALLVVAAQIGEEDGVTCVEVNIPTPAFPYWSLTCFMDREPSKEEVRKKYYAMCVGIARDLGLSDSGVPMHLRRRHVASLTNRGMVGMGVCLMWWGEEERGMEVDENLRLFDLSDLSPSLLTQQPQVEVLDVAGMSRRVVTEDKKTPWGDYLVKLCKDGLDDRPEHFPSPDPWQHRME